MSSDGQGVQASLKLKAATELGAETDTLSAMPSPLARLESTIVGGLALCALLLCSYNVAARYFNPALVLELVEEVQVYLIVWAVFLGLGVVTLQDRHVKADLFVSLLPIRYARRLATFNNLLGLGFTCLLLWFGVAIAYQAWDYGDVSITRLRFPLWIYIAALPAGALTMAAAYITRIVRTKRLNNNKTTHPNSQKQQNR